LIQKAKVDYYSGMINENSSDQKTVFKIANELLYRKQNTGNLPTHTSPRELADKFATFFSDKITNIRANLRNIIPTDSYESEAYKEPTVSVENILDTLSPASEEEVLKIINSAPAKSCESDPIPTKLLKELKTVLLPVITKIVNLSL
jgi:hypothetical protein